MREYQAFVLAFEGNVIERRTIVCADEAEAVEQAKRLIGTRPVELWEGARRVARFKATSASG